MANGNRTYLPRLGSSLSAITTNTADPARYLVSQADNTIRLINMAAMAVEASIHGLRPPPLPISSSSSSTGRHSCSWDAGSPVLQPGTGHLVVPCANALLQFFDAARDRHVGRMQVRGETVGRGELCGVLAG